MDTLTTRDAAVLWHPYTQHQTAPDCLAVARAHGARLYLEDGRELLDLISSWWTTVHGHAHLALVDAISQQAAVLDHVLFAGCTHEPAVRLAEGLIKAAPPGLARVFYSDNGSTAVEVALKMALQYWRNQGQSHRRRVIALDGGYHGDTFGAMAAGASSGFFAAYADSLPAMVDTLPHQAEAVFAYLEQHGPHTACILMEPLVQGAGGMRMHSPDHARSLCLAARQHGVLLVFDEVMTGFGRTGTLFAAQQIGITPDFLCLSKGITGGALPLAATLTSAAVYTAFLGLDFSKALAHGHSYTGNPIACAAACASLDLLQKPETLAAIQAIEAVHRVALPRLCAALPFLAHPRITGTIAAVDITGIDGAYNGCASQTLRQAFVDAGLLLRPLGNTLYLMPPYAVTAGELENAYSIIEKVLRETV